MLDTRYNALAILTEACALIPKNFKQLVLENEVNVAELKNLQSMHGNREQEITCLRKLLAVKKEDLHKHYGELNVAKQKKIKTAVDTIHQLLLLAVKNGNYDAKQRMPIYDALRLLTRYFPSIKTNGDLKEPDTLLREFALFYKKNMPAYIAIYSATLVSAYATALLRHKSYPEGLSERLLHDMVGPFTKNVFIFGGVATFALLHEKYRNLQMFTILLLMIPIPAVTMYRQSTSKERGMSLLWVLAGALLGFIFFAGIVVADYILNMRKYRIDSQRELFFQSLLPLPDPGDVKKIEANDEKKKEANTVSIFRKLFAMRPFSLPRLFQNKNVDQQTESHSAHAHSQIVKPDCKSKLEPRLIKIKEAPPLEKRFYLRR